MSFVSNVATVETVIEDEETPVTSETSGESDPVQPSKFVKNMQDFYDVPLRLPRFSPEELIGLSFLHDDSSCTHPTRVEGFFHLVRAVPAQI